MNKAKRMTRVSLHNMLKAGEEVWVTNMTGTKHYKGRRKEAGPISLMIGVAGNSDAITVPPGRDPVCLTDLTDLESLKTCRDLFKSVDSGGLKVLSPDDAEQYYETHEARKEIMEAKMEKYLKQERVASVPEHLQEQNFDPRPVTKKINPKVPDLCLKAKHKRFKESEVLEQLLEIAPSFGEEEFQYIASNGGYKAVKDWAKDMVKDLLDDPIEQG